MFGSFLSDSGIENPGLEMQPTLAIAVPFTPTVGCRIDFNNIPLHVLTPCSMLSNKLVFSPIKKPSDLTPKRPNLSIISEEAVDISKELESYQLELENSMNEAKATKKRDNKNLMDMRRKSTFARRLLDAVGADDEDHSPQQTEQLEENEEETANNPSANTNIEHSCQENSDGHSDCPKSSTPKTPNENCIAKYPLESIGENPDVVYEEVDETHIEHDVSAGVAAAAPSIHNDDVENVANESIKSIEKIEFKNPAPFVRTYRRDGRKPIVNHNDAAAQTASTNEKSKEHHEMFGSIRSSIRKSIRKLIQPDGSAKSKGAEHVPSNDGGQTTPTSSASSSSKIFSSIRHSLRRKQPPKQPLATSTPYESLNDISIIDNCKPRAVFKDTAAGVAEKAIAMDTDNDAHAGSLFRGRTTIRNSFRKSSRHVMKSVFKKNIEDYNL